jgi:hypothetical protein
MDFYDTYSAQLAKRYDYIMHDDTDEKTVSKELFVKKIAKDVPQFNIDKLCQQRKNNALQNQQSR